MHFRWTKILRHLNRLHGCIVCIRDHHCLVDHYHHTSNTVSITSTHVIFDKSETNVFFVLFLIDRFSYQPYILFREEASYFLVWIFCSKLIFFNQIYELLHANFVQISKLESITHYTFKTIHQFPQKIKSIDYRKLSNIGVFVQLFGTINLKVSALKIPGNIYVSFKN